MVLELRSLPAVNRFKKTSKSHSLHNSLEHLVQLPARQDRGDGAAVGAVLDAAGEHLAHDTLTLPVARAQRENTDFCLGSLIIN